MSELPSWLEARPTDARDSLMAGLQLGMQFREVKQRHAMAQQQLGLEKQRLDASQKNAALMAQVRREGINANLQRALTQLELTKSYHDAALGLAKSRIDQEGQKIQQAKSKTTREAFDTVGYANAVASGKMTPLQARARYPMAKLPGGETKAAPEETFTRRTYIDAKPEVPATPAQPASKGLLGGWLFGLGAHPPIPAVPGQPAKAKGELTETVKAPPGTDAASAFQSAQSPAAPVGPGTQSATPQKFKKGDRVKQNGAIYEFDGQGGWNPIKE